MSRTLFLAVSLLTFAVVGQAQAQASDGKTPQEVARTYTQQGDYTNAIVVLNGALQKDPRNLELSKDLSFNYYLSRDYTKGLSIAKPLIDRPDADVQTYQIVGMFYKVQDDRKECEKLYRAGLKRFPRSGVLYNEYGEVLWALLYGEIFINLESYSKRTAEMKDLLLAGYKKLFLDPDMKKDQDTKNSFGMAWLNVMAPLNFTVRDGITAESLTVL